MNILRVACATVAFASGWVMAQDDDARDTILAPEQAAKVNSSGWNLLKGFLARGDDNIAISPASIRGAFCPLQYGLGGNTLKEVEDVMGDGAAFDRFITQYNKANNGASLANRLVVDKTVPLKPPFVKAVPEDLLKTADFAGDPEGERKSINGWIEKNTNGMIKDMLPASIFKSRDLRFLSANAAAFEANWKYPFDEKSNTDAVFHGSMAESNTTMMFRKLTGIVTECPDSSVVVALPYENPDDPHAVSDISFVAVMPGEDVKLNDFVKEAKWDDLVKSFDRESNNPREFKLTMPKFIIETPLLELKRDLEGLGIKEIFSRSADFSRMTDEKGLAASGVYHKCYIKVFEKGTKAAAATVISVVRMAAPINQIEVRLDRPFLWLIYDQKQNLVLFCGTYSMPSGAGNEE